MEKACGCIIFHNNKVLVIQSLAGDYGFPKGHINPLESEVACAIRETKEEVGVDVSVGAIRLTINYMVNGALKEVVYFAATCCDDSIKIQEDEIKQAMWVDCDKVSDILSFPDLKELWYKMYEQFRSANGKVDF